MQIYELFPTTVVKTKMAIDMPPEVVKYIKTSTRRPNFANSTSFESKILDLLEFATIKNEVTLAFKNYLDTIIVPKNDVEVGITQSWINWTENGQAHHEHNHSNSYLSAVVYLEAYEEDKITFATREYKQLDIETKEPSIHNATSWWVGVETGDIVIFPSKLLHYVEPREDLQGTRISLAVNMIPRGKIGDSARLTELYL